MVSASSLLLDPVDFKEILIKIEINKKPKRSVKRLVYHRQIYNKSELNDIIY